MRPLLQAITAITVGVLLVRTCGAQSVYRHELGLAGGVSPASGGPIGTTPDRQLFVVSANYGLVVLRRSSVMLKYDASVLPIVLVHRQRRREALELGGAKTTYGAGLEPLGFQTNFRPRQMVQPFLNTAGGILYFHDQVPVLRASQLNFTFSFGGRDRTVYTSQTFADVWLQVSPPFKCIHRRTQSGDRFAHHFCWRFVQTATVASVIANY
jgi:hypothetical protein